jgi:hypothetical protein
VELQRSERVGVALASHEHNRGQPEERDGRLCRRRRDVETHPQSGQAKADRSEHLKEEEHQDKAERDRDEEAGVSDPEGCLVAGNVFAPASTLLPTSPTWGIRAM